MSLKPGCRNVEGFFAIVKAGKALFTVVLVGIFMVVGPALMILNKEIIDRVVFRYPILVSSMGVIASCVLTQVLAQLGMLRLEYASTVTCRFWVTRCLQVGICHAATSDTYRLVSFLISSGMSAP